MKTLLALLIILAPAVVLSTAAVAAPAPQATEQQIKALETDLLNAMYKKDLKAVEQALANAPTDVLFATFRNVDFSRAYWALGSEFTSHFTKIKLAEMKARSSQGQGQGQGPADAVGDKPNTTVVVDDTIAPEETPPEIGKTSMTGPAVLTAVVVVGVAVAVANKNDDKAKGPTDTTAAGN